MRLLFVIVTINLSVCVAHTSYKVKITCPIDGHKFEIYATGSYTTTGSYYDFQKRFIGDLYESSVVSCSKCHYAGYKSDFDTTYTDAIKDSILYHLEPYKNEKLDNVLENEITVTLYRFFNKPNNQIAHLYLVASYFLRFDTSKQEKRKELQLNCIKYIVKAIELNEYDDKETYASQYYLIGELYRRVGDFENALKYYQLAANQKSKPKWLDEVLETQIEMAKIKDDNNQI